MNISDDRGDELAPVIPLFGGDHTPDRADVADHDWHTTWRDLSTQERVVVGLAEADHDSAVAEAEAELLRATRQRGLSVREARQRLRGRDGLPEGAAEEILQRLERWGALDDAALAAQLVRAGVERKGQGRRAIAQTLGARGIPREVSELALAELPDDDSERALDYARTKARSLARHDDDTALRRLIGQLARRGYGGGLAMSAARQALDEARRAGGVRFR